MRGTNTIRGIRNAIVTVAVLLALSSAALADNNILHEFAGGNNDGSYPNGSLILSGSMLYGMTNAGGDGDYGVVFKMGTGGSGYTHLHEFASGNGDGAWPHGSLTLSSSTLYGMTKEGGDSDFGVVFKVNTDGTGYTNLHEFAGGAADGDQPYGSLTLVGPSLYGMTRWGGDSNCGVVFKINTDGGGFELLHEFADGGDDGSHPRGSLTLSGSTLYGMTDTGGDSNFGVVFKMNTDGIGYTHLHEFAGGNADGRYTSGSLTLSGSILYGMTHGGGDNDYGVVFKINTDGSGYSILHEFAGGSDDGSQPYGSLTLVGSKLYGVTNGGGDEDRGVVFKMNADGSGFELIHEFAGGSDDGMWPYCDQLAVGADGLLYGMTANGGDNARGVIYSVVPEPVTLILLGAGALAMLKRRGKK